MWKFVIGLSALVVALPLAAARADDPAQAKAVLDKAIQAAGGEQTLARFKAVTVKGKGTLHEKKDTPFTTEVSVEGADRASIVNDSKEDGKPTREVDVIDGDKGWTKKDNEAAEELDDATLKDLKEWLYVNWVTTLVPLRGEGFQLTPLGDSRAGGRAVVGLRVAHKGHKDVELFFDKETGLLAKSRAQVKDVESGKEVTESTLYEQYKEFQGTKQPTKITTLWDGKPREELELTEVRLAEKLPDKVFAKP